MARLDFSNDNDDAYWSQRDGLLEELGNRLGPDADQEIVGDAGIFMDWTINYSDGDLSRYGIYDIEEYLLEWCPRKVSTDPAGYLPLVEGAKQWILHLALTGQWNGGPVQPVLSHFERIVPEFLKQMSDPANFGMAKSMFNGPALGGADIDIDDPDSIQAALGGFGAGVLGPGVDIDLDDLFAGVTNAESLIVDLPPTPSIDETALAAQLAEVPLIGQIAAVREYLGPKGITLTSTGNPKLVDAKALMGLFETDDQWERTEADGTTKQVRSADQLPQLQYLLTLAEVVEATVDNGRRITPTDGWDDIDPFERCQMLLAGILELGVSQRSPNQYRTQFVDSIDDLLDMAVIHLLVPVFLDGAAEYDQMLDRLAEIMSEGLALDFPQLAGSTHLGSLVEDDLRRCIDVFVRCGVLTWRDHQVTLHRVTGRPVPTGGTIAMGDLGRALFAPVLESIGYRPHTLADLADCSAMDAANMLTAIPDSDPADVFSEWLGETDPADKVDKLIDALVEAVDPYERMGLSALLAAAPDDARRRVESIVDGPLAAYALMVIDRSLIALSGVDPDDESADAASAGDASAGDVGADHTVAGDGAAPMIRLTDGRTVVDVLSALDRGQSLLPLIDVLWARMVEDPDELLLFVAQIGNDDGPDFIELSKDLWRVPVPQTAELLEFIGIDHPDKALAKAARKALFRHRSVRHQ